METEYRGYRVGLAPWMRVKARTLHPVYQWIQDNPDKLISDIELDRRLAELDKATS